MRVWGVDHDRTITCIYRNRPEVRTNLKLTNLEWKLLRPQDLGPTVAYKLHRRSYEAWAKRGRTFGKESGQ